MKLENKEKGYVENKENLIKRNKKLKEKSREHREMVECM